MNKNSTRILMLIPATLLLITIVALFVPDDVIGALNGKITPTGSIIVYIKDGNTDTPLEFARIVIPETGQAFLTDENGKTDTIRVPIIEDSEYEAILPKPWGEITLLVYKEGYVECAIFHVNIWENQTRHGPTVLLFPVSPDESNEPFTLTEGPNRLWVKQLLGKYRTPALH